MMQTLIFFPNPYDFLHSVEHNIYFEHLYRFGQHEAELMMTAFAFLAELFL